MSNASADENLAFSARLSDKLQDDAIEMLSQREMKAYQALLPLGSGETSKQQKRRIRELTISIWNACNAKQDMLEFTSPQQLSQLRGFCCLLLLGISHGNSKNVYAICKLFEICSTTIRACIRHEQYNMASRLLENDLLHQAYANRSFLSHGNDLSLSTFVRFHFLRLLLAWKRNRMDLVEHLYEETFGQHMSMTSEDAFYLVDILFDIAWTLMSRVEHSNALCWLERATELMNDPRNLDQFDKTELKLNVYHSMVQILGSRLDESSLTRAASLLACLEGDYGSRMSVLTLCVDLALQDTMTSVDDASTTIKKLIDIAHLIPANHNLITHYLHHFQLKDFAESVRLLQIYVLMRLVPENKQEWIEQSILNYLASYTKSEISDVTAHFQQLRIGLDSFYKALSTNLPSSGTHTAHTIIWLAIQKADQAGQRHIAALWCQVGLHDLFKSVGDVALSMMRRQLCMFHILKSDANKARITYDGIAVAQRAHPRSRFVLYCIGLLENAESDSQAHLLGVIQAAGVDDQILQVCISQSEGYNKPLHSVQLLQHLVDSQHNSYSLEVRLDMLKYVVSQIQKALDTDEQNYMSKDDLLFRLCCAFRKVDNLLGNTTDRGRWQKHADWFSQSCFYVVINHLQTWPTQHLIDLTCYATNLCWPRNDAMIEIALSKDQQKRLQDATFIRALSYGVAVNDVAHIVTTEDLPRTAYSSEAKPCPDEFRTTLYRNIFLCFSKFETLQTMLNCTSTSDGTANSQLHVLIPLTFESLLVMSATAHLRDGTPFDETSITGLVHTAAEFRAPASVWATMCSTLMTYVNGQRGDGIKVSSGPAGRILNQLVSNLSDMDIQVHQLARWFRCVVQLLVDDIEGSLSSTALEGQTSYKKTLLLLDRVYKQVIDLARRTRSQKPVELDASTKVSTLYPDDELGWIVTKMFNLAIKFKVVVEDDVLAEVWAIKAREIAEAMTNGRMLVKTVQQKARALSMDREEASSDR